MLVKSKESLKHLADSLLKQVQDNAAQANQPQGNVMKEEDSYLVNRVHKLEKENADLRKEFADRRKENVGLLNRLEKLEQVVGEMNLERHRQITTRIFHEKVRNKVQLFFFDIIF
jgi:hypothetical protein